MEDLQKALSSQGLTSSSNPDKGRCLVSMKNFNPGDVIIREDPYASVPNNSNNLRCNGCFTDKNLRRCSACHMVWYCGSSCQKAEWRLHKLECQVLIMLTHERRKMLTPSIWLLVRILLRRKLQNDQIISSTSTDNFHLVEILVDHMDDINEKQLVLYAQMANLVALVLPFLDISIREIARFFSKLSCNAHTICDSELRPLGTGLYPVISIINHSCMPNSVLVFEGRSAVVRAVDHVAKGDEVSISYIETAGSASSRLKVLKEQYFFTCQCPRCIKMGSYEEIEDARLEGYRCKDTNCDGFLILDSNNKIYSCQRCSLARKEHEIKVLAREVEEESEKASRLLSHGNHSEVSIIFKRIEQLQLKLCHSHSIKLMQTRDNLLKIFLDLKDWREALSCCRLTIPVYERVYPAIHPLLGLQYYTCGKLEWLLGYTEDALETLTKAADILRITHGMSAPLVRELFSKMEEVRGEAAYKLSLSSSS